MNEVVVATKDEIFPDRSNPRKSDPTRAHLLELSIRKLGFIQPIFVNTDGMILSGHQRYDVSTSKLGYEEFPVIEVDLKGKDVKGVNVMFNRATNDFTAFETGSSSAEKIDIAELMMQAEALPDAEYDWAYDCEVKSIEGLAQGLGDKHNRKSILTASSLRRKGVYIPIVVSEDGRVINGIHRLFDARHEGLTEWPIITIPDDVADLAVNMLNYLSMDYEVDGEFAELLRYSAYRRPQNNRGKLAKAFRFWANGNRTLPDSESYSKEYWQKFRSMHGGFVCDFGAGLCNAAPYLERKGIECLDFEPFRIDPSSDSKKPDPDYSRHMAREFLQTFAEEDRDLGSIFLCSVLNSIPFPRDRQCVLAIVHAMCGFRTGVYGTCRDISDFNYEYSGIRNASYFVFDSEPGVRLGDAISNPKIQKFHTQDEFKHIASFFWSKVETWSGGNVFYWKATAPKRVNKNALREALEFEFDLPFSDGSRMGLAEEAIQAFEQRGIL